MGEKDSLALLAFQWRKGPRAKGVGAWGRSAELTLPMGLGAHFGGRSWANSVLILSSS